MESAIGCFRIHLGSSEMLLAMLADIVRIYEDGIFVGKRPRRRVVV